MNEPRHRLCNDVDARFPYEDAPALCEVVDRLIPCIGVGVGWRRRTSTTEASRDPFAICTETLFRLDIRVRSVSESIDGGCEASGSRSS